MFFFGYRAYCCAGVYYIVFIFGCFLYSGRLYSLGFYFFCCGCFFCFVDGFCQIAFFDSVLGLCVSFSFVCCGLEFYMLDEFV